MAEQSSGGSDGAVGDSGMSLVRALTVIAAVLTVGMVPAAGAVAQTSPSMHFGVMGGLSRGLGDFGDRFGTGPCLGVLSEGAPSGFPVGLRGELLLSGPYIPKGGGSLENFLLGFLLNVVINFDTPRSGVYLIGGAGMHVVHLPDDHVSTNSFAVNGGGGIRLPLPGVSILAEARLHHVWRSGKSPTFIPIVLGVVF